MRSHIPLETHADNTLIKGEIVVLHPGEIHIKLLDPYGVISGSTHGFFKSESANPFEEGGQLTGSGKVAAEGLLKNIYKYADYFARHITELRRFYDPLRPRIEAATEKLKSTIPDSQKKVNPQAHSEALQELLWLNNEYYVNITDSHSGLRGIGMDTLVDLTGKFL